MREAPRDGIETEFAEVVFQITEPLGSSPPRRRGGEFTFEVQRFGEGLGWSAIAEALSRNVIVERGELADLTGCDGGQIGLARQLPAQPPDRVLNAALLPRRIGIAEVRLDAEGLTQSVVMGELCPVVEGDALAKLSRQRREQGF